MNTAGFYGYTLASVYPNMGNGQTQTMETTPEPEEQKAYTQIDAVAAPAVDSKAKMNVWLLLGGMVGLIVLFGGKRG